VARILIVEDDVRTADFIGSYFRAAGHDYVVAGNGQQALESAKSDPVDLLILDIMLPGGISGFEVCRRIRSDAELYTLPILIVSAMAGDEEVAHGLAQGADDYVPKPFDVHHLLQRIDALLRSSAGIQTLDEMTELPQSQAIKREVQRKVSRQQEFVLAYVELVRLREFGRMCGPEGRGKAIRHLARVLKLCGQNLGPQDFLVGHMGGGHFVGVLSPESAEPYCQYVSKTWHAHLPALYESVGLQRHYLDTIAGKAHGHEVPVLEVLMCATPHHPKHARTAKELFNSITQIRNSALAAHSAGIHFDRRA
jgi:DNA-binding response OmpR family regulator